MRHKRITLHLFVSEEEIREFSKCTLQWPIKIIIMEALLHQSRSMCPFLMKTSPATLRSLSTSTTRNASACGSTLSNLQLVARRCPVMSKALAVQSVRGGHHALAGVFGGSRAYTKKAGLHTSRAREARVDVNPFSRDNGTSHLKPHITTFS